MGRILITGSTGNVGSAVAEYARQIKQDFVCASSKESGDDRVFLNFSDPSSFGKALEGVDRVFLIRPPQMGNPQELTPFIDALKAKSDLKLVTFLSLLGIEHNPVPPHYKIEKYIEKSGFPFCHIRPSFFMQNISGIHAFEVKYFDRLVVPVGKALTSFIDAKDIGTLIAHVLSEPEKHCNTAYSITGAEAIDYWAVAEILSQELGRTILYGNPSAREAKKYWVKIRGIEPGYAFVMSMLYLMTRLGTARTITHTFEDIMERKPRSFQQFVHDNRSAWENLPLKGEG